MWKIKIYKSKKLLLAVSIILIFLSVIFIKSESDVFKTGVRIVLYPLQKVFSYITLKAGNTYKSLFDYLSLKGKNEELTKELVFLRRQNLDLKEKIKKFERIKLLDEFRKKNSIRSVLASVISLEPTNYISSCIINKGYKEGITSSQVVVNEKGVIGRIVNVSAYTSDIIFLNDPNCKVSAITTRSRVFGVVKGSGKDKLEMLYLSVGDDVKEGDEVISAGEGNIFPKGLPIGRVSKIMRYKNDVSLYVEITPYAKFSKIEEVIVLVSK